MWLFWALVFVLSSFFMLPIHVFRYSQVHRLQQYIKKPLLSLLFVAFYRVETLCLLKKLLCTLLPCFNEHTALLHTTPMLQRTHSSFAHTTPMLQTNTPALFAHLLPFFNETHSFFAHYSHSSSSSFLTILGCSLSRLRKKMRVLNSEQH